MNQPMLSSEVHPVRTADKVRHLSADVLGIEPYVPARNLASIVEEIRDDAGGLPEMPEDDPLYALVIELLADGYGGIILTGPPGTSKSYYATAIGRQLVDDDEQRIRFIQFHPSYQYEDFVEGYVPVESGFELRSKHLLQMCEIAHKHKDQLCVLVIDELSRAEPGRVFGEALTYIETTMRDRPFQLSSGKTICIPHNLVFLATMNSYDRGVDEIDAALERRFAKIAMDPSDALLADILSENQMDETLQDRVLRFFRDLQRNPNQYCHIGHAFFVGIRDEAGLQRLWQYQLRFVMERAFRHDRDGYRGVESQWKNIFSQSVSP